MSIVPLTSKGHEERPIGKRSRIGADLCESEFGNSRRDA
jgi:hypothetical protein